MKTIELDISSISSHQDAVKSIIDFAENEKIFLFDAPMGAGKTTFIKSFCEYLGVSDTMSSPTYSIVNEYRTKSNNKIFHFDLYRLKSEQELFELGFEEYISSNQYVFVEWPEMAIPYLDTYLRIIIKQENNNRYLCAQIIKKY
ncbi:MAG TPA: tRNA (adenosine(37)-N6)-threonylcarbamoyltransferase complex ATPase subunit type 1 TsaE [Bacteroidia bacterium]|nr:tRNA (adenosine(37)-N6)-threonylcarbamoyltransferase complex ATPase subunit type 1 TsaE [Bacteroidia bacterium]